MCCNLTLNGSALQLGKDHEVAPAPERFMLVDFEVVQRAQGGDPSAFNEIVTAYRRRIFGTVARLIGRPEDVEDVAQEVFLRLYYSLGQLRNPEIFEPWLHRLTVNAGLDYLRKRKKRRAETTVSDLPDQQVMLADASASAGVERSEQEKQRVRDFVDELLSEVSAEDRALLMMKEVEGLSLKELESVYGVNENALKVRLFRARQRVLKAFAARESRGEREAQ
jgi:RNA polymerase sigma-70 factor, ECF subfamily